MLGVVIGALCGAVVFAVSLAFRVLLARWEGRGSTTTFRARLAGPFDAPADEPRADLSSLLWFGSAFLARLLALAVAALFGVVTDASDDDARFFVAFALASVTAGALLGGRYLLRDLVVTSTAALTIAVLLASIGADHAPLTDIPLLTGVLVGPMFVGDLFGWVARRLWARWQDTSR